MRSVLLPPPTQDIQKAYQNLITTLDQEIALHIARFFPNSLNCRAGCCDCCVPFSVLPLEAAHILMNLPDQPTPEENAQEFCRHLQEQKCSIYPFRPVICRTQGLPLGYIDEERAAIEVSCCPLNFRDDYAFTIDELFFLDRYNSELALLNSRYCKTQHIDPLRRIPLDDLEHQQILVSS